ncbi:MAG: hypothetical protein WEA11_08175 [Acidimicrobiales bacterium]
MGTSKVESSGDPVGQLLDLFLYAPIGLIARSADALPEIIALGRTRSSNARVVGQFALGATNAKAREAVADAEAHLSAFFRIVADSASPSKNARPTSAANQKGSTEASPAPKKPSPSKPSPKKPKKSVATVQNAISGYDDMTAAEILPRLGLLSAKQLAVVETYEQSQRARKTILNRIRQLKA